MSDAAAKKTEARLAKLEAKGWSNGLFDCCSSPCAFLKVCFCPCLAAGEIYVGSCLVGCVIFSFLGPCCYPCCFTGPLRQVKGIPGSMCTDCLLICCPLTGCCQMTRELREVRGD